MRRKDEGKDVTLPTLFDYTTILVRTETRGHVCDCLLCKIGRLQMNEKHPLDKPKPEEKNLPLRWQRFASHLQPVHIPRKPQGFGSPRCKGC